MADEHLTQIITKDKKAERLGSKREYQAAYRQKNKDKIREQNKEYTKKNRAKINARARAWAAANPEKSKERNREKYRRNPDYDKNRARARRAKDPAKDREYVRRSAVKRRYGITWIERDAIIAAQDGKCAICFTELSEKRTALDHCHISGKIRAALCLRCNTGIGMLREDITILEKAIEYIRHHKHELG